MTITTVTLYPGNTAFFRFPGTSAQVILNVPIDKEPTCEVISPDDGISQMFKFSSQRVKLEDYIRESAKAE